MWHTFFSIFLQRKKNLNAVYHIYIYIYNTIEVKDKKKNAEISANFESCVTWTLRKILQRDAFEQVIGILVNGHISTGVMTRIAQTILVKMPIEMYPFTRILMTCLKVSLMLQNFSWCMVWLTKFCKKKNFCSSGGKEKTFWSF